MTSTASSSDEGAYQAPHIDPLLLHNHFEDEGEDEDDDDGDGDQATPFQTHYPPYESDSSSSGSDTQSHPPAQHPSQSQLFFPPFYNRPPTPLPPSPSLTSLLRPSRPTTPDSSPDELHSSLSAHPSARPLPRASPKVPTYEYYGFVLYLCSSLTFLIYILWSYLPSPFLHALGVHYYPNRWWSLALPAWLVVALGYVYVALGAYNVGYLTLGLESVQTVVDQAGCVAVLRDWRDERGSGISKQRVRKGKKRDTPDRKLVGKAGAPEKEIHGEMGWKGTDETDNNAELLIKEWKEVWSRGTDAVMDVPLGGVCEVLYGEGREDWNDDDDA